MAYTQSSFINNSLAKIRNTILEALGYTPENVANKIIDLDDDSDILYPTQKAVNDALDLKADKLFYDAEIGAFILNWAEDYES